MSCRNNTKIVRRDFNRKDDRFIHSILRSNDGDEDVDIFVSLEETWVEDRVVQSGIHVDLHKLS